LVQVVVRERRRTQGKLGRVFINTTHIRATGGQVTLGRTHRAMRGTSDFLGGKNSEMDNEHRMYEKKKGLGTNLSETLEAGKKETKREGTRKKKGEGLTSFIAIEGEKRCEVGLKTQNSLGGRKTPRN